jgi:hypothetical protein
MLILLLVMTLVVLAIAIAVVPPLVAASRDRAHQDGSGSQQSPGRRDVPTRRRRG